MRVAEQIADWLVQHGIEQAFSVTGGGAMFLNHAIGGHAELKCTFMHHEQACSFAAEGYARVAGKPAVVMLTTGPGAINAFNGVFGAFTDSIPMIVISGQVKRETCLDFNDLPGLRQLGDQEGPTIAMASHICKYSRLIRTAQDLETVLPEAVAAAISGRPGPVWLDIPLDIQSATDKLNIGPLVLPAKPEPASLAASARDVLERLRKARRPLILGGTGVRLGNAVDALRTFAERAGVPVATAWTHDLIASDHPLFAGRPGTIGTRAGNFCLQNADFVLVLGSRLNIRQTSYNYQCFAKDAYLVQVDIDGHELRKPFVKPDLPIEADVAPFLDALLQELDHGGVPDFSPWAGWCRDIGRQYRVRDEHAHQPGRELNPYLVVERIFAQARPDDIFVCGNASACILPFQIGALQSGQRLFSNSGSASMGYDLPAAIGAAIAGQGTGRRVICFAGDGSLQMNIQELQTLKSLGLPVLVVVLNNAGYLSIRQTHENFFGRVIGAHPASGVEFPPFEAVAAAYGLGSATVMGEAALPILDNVLAQSAPTVMDVIVDPQQEFNPRIKSRVDENGKFVTPELDDMFPFLPVETLQAVRRSAQEIAAAPQLSGPQNWEEFAALCASLADRPQPRLAQQRPVWIFGAGGFGRDLAHILQKEGYALAGFIDSQPRQESLLGLPVRSWEQLDDAAREAQLAIGIYNRGAPFSELEARARAAGFRHVLTPIHLFAQFGEQLGWRYWLTQPDTITQALPEIEATWHSLADDSSRRCLLNLLAFRLGQNPDYAHFQHSDAQYFNALTLPPLAGKPLRFVDAGAYNGDTYLDLCRQADVAEAWLFEPDPANYAALVGNVQSTGKPVVCLPTAVAEQYAILSFNADGEGGAIKAEGAQHIAALALDELLPTQHVSFLKLDVEGAEAQALKGARKLIERSRPVLAMSLYHKPADPWELPALVRSMCPDYRFYVRQHYSNSFDCVLYAIPR